jgi:hypothetical protein
MTWGLVKKMTFRKLDPLFEGFRYEYLIKLNNQKNFKIAPNKKLCEMPWGPILKGQERFFKIFKVLWWFK